MAPTVKDILAEIKQFLIDRNWDNQFPGDVSKSISIEAAELLELFQWGHPTKEDILSNPAKLEKIRQEVADVLIYSLELTNLLGIDPVEAIREKLVLNSLKYPADLMKKTEEGHSETYFQIKEKHRQCPCGWCTGKNDTNWSCRV